MEDNLPEPILLIVLRKTAATDCARAGCVSRRWSRMSSDNELWQSFCLRDFSVATRVDPQGNPCKSYKETYNSWWTIFNEYPKPLVSRAKQCWNEIKDWLKVNFVEVLNSLVQGVSVDEIKAAEEELGFQLPDCMRVLYQLCNGQVFPDDESYDKNDGHHSNRVGLLGGYSFYQHFVNVHLLPLNQVVRLTRAITEEFGLPRGSKRVVFAASCNSVKVFFLDCNDGQVYVGTRNLQLNGEMMPCTPSQGVYIKDGILRWLERYNHCLQAGIYNVRVEKGIRSISLFPSKAPFRKEAVTKGLEDMTSTSSRTLGWQTEGSNKNRLEYLRGKSRLQLWWFLTLDRVLVQIQTSAVFVPELSTTQEDHDDPYVFSYSVGMRLLPPSSENSGSDLESAQLLARHWISQREGFPPSEVRGAAVIGQYPILKAGGERFVYQSCSSQKSKSGTFEGDFTFVPGRLVRPAGSEFTAYVARLQLEVPEYVF